MANGNGRVLSIVSLIISSLALIATGLNAYVSYQQFKDLHEQFDLTGGVLSVETSAQVRYSDGRQPVTLDEEQHPILTSQNFDTPGELYLVYKVTNVGRGATNLLGAELRIGQNIAIKASDPTVRSLCAAGGKGLADCQQVFDRSNPPLEPGWIYYVYFPLTSIRDKLKVGAGLQGEIDATGLRSRVLLFPLGIGVNLQQ